MKNWAGGSLRTLRVPYLFSATRTLGASFLGSVCGASGVGICAGAASTGAGGGGGGGGAEPAVDPDPDPDPEATATVEPEPESTSFFRASHGIKITAMTTATIATSRITAFRRDRIGCSIVPVAALRMEPS